MFRPRSTNTTLEAAPAHKAPSLTEICSKARRVRGYMYCCCPNSHQDRITGGPTSVLVDCPRRVQRVQVQRKYHTNFEIAQCPESERNPKVCMPSPPLETAGEAAPAKAKFKRVRRPTDLARRKDLCHVRPRDSHPVLCSQASLTNMIYMSEASIYGCISSRTSFVQGSSPGARQMPMPQTHETSRQLIRKPRSHNPTPQKDRPPNEWPRTQQQR